MRFLQFIGSCLLIIFTSSVLALGPSNQRESDFNFDWKFTLVDSRNLPDQVPLNDQGWRDVRLPHDWSVEASFAEKWEGATGYLPGGVGIYQKHFKTPANPKTKNTYVLFDGVYNNATFWLNGQRLGENPYGYSPVYWDLTKYLNTDGSDNILTVHVDHSRYVDSRWYTGSGIYRNVTLVTTDKLHIPIWGTFVTTPEVNPQQATVKVAVEINNSDQKDRNFVLVNHIVNAKGEHVASVEDDYELDAGERETFEQQLSVAKPNLWDTQNPNMYRVLTQIYQDDTLIDSYTTSFGIRDIKFEAGKGFFLNGKPTLMKGVSLHHDGGLVGAAVPKGVWKRRLQSLKDAGVNAIRTAHNPFSQEFLDLCDELGILVQNEFFDEFDNPKDKRLNKHDRHDDYISRGYDMHFQKWAKSDLTRTMLRDRNHPSVVQWSIGNEIEWTYLNYRFVTGYWTPDAPDKDGNFWGGLPKYSPEELKKRYDETEKGPHLLHETAQKLAKWTRELDTTRPVTTNMIIPQVSMVTGYADAVDIAGFSYRNITIPWAQTHFPDKLITINENPGLWGDWLQVLENPGVFSIFMWTGIDYMGEHHNKWPEKSGWGDILDLAGFKRQGWNYFKSYWVNEPHLSLGTLPLKGSGFKKDELSNKAIPIQKDVNGWGGSFKLRDSNMHWDYKEGDLVLVEVASNHATVELLLNGRSLGYRSLSESGNRIVRWIVPYEPGTLMARAGFDGQQQEVVLASTSEPAALKFTSDKANLTADAYDVAHLVVQLVDDKGRAIRTQDLDVTFEIDGPAKLLGVDNGAPDNIQDFQSNKLTTDKGRALAIIQSLKTPGLITITASAKGFAKQRITIDSQ
ncbi:glycoside hydrolase family 2 TIM barrel-domain containing protein [Gayadomonas joobiniege]|uniref:glycoside hydrolase family 2 TIM barrel-domain containing protein n=1 Tax=Gayadomonas joobiniege TaxID=1234606 RepID=UPI000376EBD4|nr:glycoside hydrolase family 2 TIM barrel-domain containing protein [Gayadomonas joobiniege]